MALICEANEAYMTCRNAERSESMSMGWAKINKGRDVVIIYQPNRRGKVLVSHGVDRLAQSRHRHQGGFEVQAENDTAKYQTSLEPTDEEIASIYLARSNF